MKAFFLLVVTQLAMASTTASEFKLYPTPKATPNPECDMHRHLLLLEDASDYQFHSLLYSKVDGSCEIAVLEDQREYGLKAPKMVGSCGSRVFTGNLNVVGNSDGSKGKIEILDNRGNTCEMSPIAAIVVTETDASGVVRKIYSRD